MTYGEMGEEALKWAAQSAFGLKPTSMPTNIVIIPSRLQTFPDLPAILDGNALTFKKAGNGFLVWNNSRRVLFCEGGLGESNFADSSHVLCY